MHAGTENAEDNVTFMVCRAPMVLWICAGYFQQRLRIYDLQKMDSEPATFRDVPDKIRSAAWHQNDKLLLTSYIDQPGIGYLSIATLSAT